MISTLQNKREKIIAGLMSGTSADGIDTAFVKIKDHGIDTQIELLAFETFSYPDNVADKIHQFCQAEIVSLDELSQLNFLTAQLFAESVQKLSTSSGISVEKLDLIGSHGQTIRHLPDPQDFLGYKVTSTLQIADPSVIAQMTGIPTVGDFRPADMAQMGQGAPLIPIFDYFMFHSTENSKILLNIGGISNFTILPKACKISDIIAFDTGPGNTLLDRYCEKFFHIPYDKNGKIAAAGTVNHELLNTLLKDAYFQQCPPKSTGREYFGYKYLKNFISKTSQLGMTHQDSIATLTALTIKSVFHSYQQFIHIPVKEIIVSGGGIFNKTMMRMLQKEFSDCTISTTDDYGIPSEAKEAMCFAVLANETIHNSPGNIPSATGAQKPAVLGKICL